MTKRALLIGINNYPYYPLPDGINNVNAWQAYLQPKGYSITKLLDNQATKSAILTKLTLLVNASQPGDSLVMMFSGHGSYVADQNGDELDGYDEVICPVNYFSGQYIRDDDLKGILNTLRAGVNVDIFMDCCYAGTNTKTIDTIPKFIPARQVKKPRVLSKFVNVPGLNHCLWSGCGEHQTSQVIIVNGTYKGAFTYAVLKKLGELPQAPRSSIIDATAVLISQIGLSQVPQLECTEVEAAQLPFN